MNHQKGAFCIHVSKERMVVFYTLKKVFGGASGRHRRPKEISWQRITEEALKCSVLRIETDSKPRMWINDVAKEMDFIKVKALNDLHFKSSFGKRFLAKNEGNPLLQ